MAGSWVRAGVLVGAPELITELGGDPRAVAARAGLDPRDIDQPDMPIAAAAVADYFEFAAEAVGRSDFGLRLAGRQSLAVLGPVWSLMSAARDVRQMLTDLARYFMIHTASAIVGAEALAEGVALTYSLATDTRVTDRQTVELGLAILTGELRRHAPPGWQPDLVQFRHDAPDDWTLHRRVLGPHLMFNQDRHALIVDNALLARPLAHAATAAHDRLRRSLDDQRGRDPARVRVQVETAIRALLPYSACSIELVADTIGLSERSLQRHLGASNLTFKDVRDQVRADLALGYLRQSALSLAQIGEILGYAEPAVFSRAFRRWYGRTARQVRREAATRP
jgi:AraC-like DNA-binding protein